MESNISVGLHVTTGNNAFVIVLNISHILLSRSVIRYSICTMSTLQLQEWLGRNHECF